MPIPQQDRVTEGREVSRAARSMTEPHFSLPVQQFVSALRRRSAPAYRSRRKMQRAQLFLPQENTAGNRTTDRNLDISSSVAGPVMSPVIGMKISSTRSMGTA